MTISTKKQQQTDIREFGLRDVELLTEHVWIFFFSFDRLVSTNIPKQGLTSHGDFKKVQKICR